MQRLFGRQLDRLEGGAVYELSAHGALYNALLRFSNDTGFDFACSEYFEDAHIGEVRNGVSCENVERLTFADGSFNLITSTDVFEHVEHDDVGFAEIARVLRPGGHFVFTVPFDSTAKTVERAARRDDGTIEHFMTPEYHGDPFRGSAGVFTWRTYGTDIAGRMRSAGLIARIEPVQVSGLRGGRLPVIVAQSLG